MYVLVYIRIYVCMYICTRVDTSRKGRAAERLERLLTVNENKARACVLVKTRTWVVKKHTTLTARMKRSMQESSEEAPRLPCDSYVWER